MEKKDFSVTAHFSESPAQVYESINQVNKWWSESIDGITDRAGEEFLYHYKDVHTCQMKILEMQPNKKVVWLVLNNHFKFTSNHSEWKGDRIVFEIEEEDNGTKLTFTQQGLNADCECYNVCHDAWTGYINGSLSELIRTGKGRPNPLDGGLNEELIRKWNLPNK